MKRISMGEFESWLAPQPEQKRQMIRLVVRNLVKATDMPLIDAVNLIYQTLNKQENPWPPKWLGW